MNKNQEYFEIKIQKSKPSISIQKIKGIQQQRTNMDLLRKEYELKIQAIKQSHDDKVAALLNHICKIQADFMDVNNANEYQEQIIQEQRQRIEVLERAIGDKK